MPRFMTLPCFLTTAALAAASASAQDISISDGNVQFAKEFNATPVVYTATADFLRADPGGDPAGVLFASAWAYRIDSDTREFIFNDGAAQATFSSVGNVGTATWADVDARGVLSATLHLYGAIHERNQRRCDQQHGRHQHLG